MLNRLLLTLALLFSFNSFAESSSMHAQQAIEITPEYLKIREPFTALAVANLQIKNNTDKDIKIKKLKSNQARHTGIYKKSLNDFGAEQISRAKNVYIQANSTTQFKQDKLMIMLTGLKRKYQVDEEIELIIEFEDHGKFTTYLPVHANYK